MQRHFTEDGFGTGLLQIAREKMGDNDPNTKKVLVALVAMKAKKKAMDEAMARLS